MSSADDMAKKLQDDVQAELESREWAEPGDNVMAEYVCVLLANGNTRDRMQEEMADLVGTEFDPTFLDWLFAHHATLQESPAAPSSTAPAAEEAAAPSSAAPSAAGRMFASAVEGTKRKPEAEPLEPSTRRRLPDGPLGAPTGPRSMRDRELLPDRPHDRRDDRRGGPSLMDRLGPQGGRGGPPMRPGMNPRGMANGRGPMNGGPMGPGGPGFQGRPPFGNPGMMMPGQEQMMMQMMAMQANMAQMAQQMAKMSEEKTSRPVRPARGTPTKAPFTGKSSAPATPKNAGGIPDRPLSTALCKFGVGCTNARCTYSHPSPVADEKSGMVLSEEACEAGKDCKDAECIKSHVSPAAVLGGAAAGPSRVLCKFQHCTNPSCQYRHEDADGNFIPPPALNASQASPSKSTAADGNSREDEPEVVIKASLDTALDDGHQERPCRYGERCTRADCKFTHPASRPTPRGGKAPVRGRPRPATATNTHDSIAGGMMPSRKFAAPVAESKLNPAAGEFKPASENGEKDISVSM